jgi:hypothetical protein
MLSCIVDRLHRLGRLSQRGEDDSGSYFKRSQDNSDIAVRSVALQQIEASINGYGGYNLIVLYKTKARPGRGRRKDQRRLANLKLRVRGTRGA